MTSLPEFDIRMKPTVRKEWLRLYPKRTDGAFWWRVGCVVRMRHIRHKDVEKIAAVCAAVDTEWPHVPWAKHNPKHDHNKLPPYPMWVGREKESDMKPTIAEFEGFFDGWADDYDIKFYGKYEGRGFHKGIAITADCVGDAGEFVGEMKGRGYTLGKWNHHDSMGFGHVLSWNVGRFKVDDETQREARDANQTVSGYERTPQAREHWYEAIKNISTKAR